MGFILVTGCGSGARLERELEAMKLELVKTRNDCDRLEERLTAVELRRIAPEEPERRGTLTHARLKVVRLAPEDEPAAAPAAEPKPAPRVPSDSAADDALPRPMIKGTGDKVYTTGDSAKSSWLLPTRGVSQAGT